MNDTLYELEKQYTSALQDYLVGVGETALERAYELGRKAIIDGLGILDMACVHHEALATVLLHTFTPKDSENTAKKAAEFFAESLAPFEMNLRGFRDTITKLGNLNKTLERSEKKFRSVVQAANDAIISADSSGSIISWNKGAQTIFGYTEEEVLGKPLTILMPQRYRDACLRELERSQLADESKYIGKTFEFYGLRRDGSEFPLEISVAAWKTEEGTFYTGIIRDITERKRALEQIREQASLLDKAQDAIVVHDLEHRITYWNKSAQRLYGFPAEEAIGKNTNELLYKDKEESQKLISANKSVIEKGEWTGELYQLTKDGNEIIVESHWTLVRDSSGNPKSILVINTDITEKKKLELQLLRAQRMESIGTLAGGISHDLNNMLTPIMLSLQILQEKFKDEESQRLLDIIERSTQRGANLVKQVMSFARGVEGEHAALQVSCLITEIERIAKETFPRYIKIRTDISKDLWTISGNATQLHQVIMNLCVNARDAMPYGGILRICAKNILIDENYAMMNTEAQAGPYVVIAVCDTGTGIPPDILDRIFEPFFTTKEPGKGTGLGLSTVHAIVKGHGGFINVHSEAGKGTIFKVYLSAIKTAQTQKVEEPLELPAGHGELILVVDDEAQIRESTRAILETYEYTVITANDGAEATALYVQNKEEIKVVLMDMMMPVMDGPASIRALRKVNPDAKIIAVSGLTERDQLEKVADTHIQAFLTKPYTAQRLLKTIHRVLNM